MTNNKKAIVFYQYLPPWRIDVFNKMGEYYDLTIVFTNAECEGFTYNRSKLLSKLKNIKTMFLNNGFKIGSRPIRLGIYRILKENNPEIVFSHEYSATSIIIAFLKQFKLLKYKYIITTSDNTIIAESSKGIKRLARDYVLKNANGLVVYSNDVKSFYNRIYPKINIEVCPNIQNPSTLLSYRPYFKEYIALYKKKFDLFETNTILYTGRLVDVKGIDLLINAFSKSNIDNYKIVIVGEGNKKNELQILSKKLCVDNKIIFAGYYDGIELYAWYDIANFFILPSRYEPFGAVVNEALIYGCPVVASKYIGALDFITEKNGKIFDPLNESEFINVLKDSCKKYENLYNNIVRHDLMPCSFDNYVKVFSTITK